MRSDQLPETPVAVSLLQCLSAAWLGAVVVVVAFGSSMPEPGIVLATSSAVGLAATAADRWLLSGDRAADAVVRRPGSSAASHSSHLPRPNDRPPGAVVPRDAPSAPQSRAVPPIMLTPLAAYLDEAESTQCPRCGGFEVERSGATLQCGICSAAWSVPGDVKPDIVIRSWLHRNQEA